MKRITLVLVALLIGTLLIGQYVPKDVYWKEDFSSVAEWNLPNGWSGNSFVQNGFGKNNTPALIMQLENWQTRIAVTPPIDIKADSRFKMSFLWVAYFGSPLHFDTNFLEIRVLPAAGPGVLGVIHRVDDSNFTPTMDWTDVSASLHEYAGQRVRIELRLVQHSQEIWQAFMQIDQVEIYTPASHELEVRTISTPPLVVDGIPTETQITIFNAGFEMATSGSYRVRIMEYIEGGEDKQLGMINGTTIPTLAVRQSTVPWVPNTEGPMTIYGIIDYIDEELKSVVIESDKTINIEVLALPQRSDVTYAGDPRSVAQHYAVPFNFNSSQAINQMIFLHDEIGEYGTITHLSFRYTGVGFWSFMGTTSKDVPLEIYMITTDKERFPYTTTFPEEGFIEISINSWFDFMEAELVFEGSIDIGRPGFYDIVIELDAPFAYTEDNLAVLIRLKNGLWGVSQMWRVTNHHAPWPDYPEWPDFNFRSVWYSNEYQTPIDISIVHNLPTGHGVQAIPNTFFGFYDGGMGGIAGNVKSDSDKNLANAIVRIEGTNRRAITNAQGNYVFPRIREGDFTLTASTRGYFDKTDDNVKITENNVTTVNFVMEEKPHVVVTGRVIASDTGQGLMGADVFLTGYVDYATESGSNGVFSIPNVYTGYPYTLRIIYSGYHSIVEEYTITESNKDLGEFTLQERAFPPVGLTAVQSSDGTHVNLSWGSPQESGRWISHNVDFDFGLYSIGVPTGQSYFVGHRFTEEQMDAMRVFGATLNMFSFFYYSTDGVVNPNAKFTIRVYSGGGGGNLAVQTNTYDPGNLVHTQEITSVRPNQWTDVFLNEYVPLPLVGDLIVGIWIENEPGYVIGCDYGPANNTFGNIVHWRAGSTDIWTTLRVTDPGDLSDVNIMIRAWVDGVPVSPFQNATRKTLPQVFTPKNNTSIVCSLPSIFSAQRVNKSNIVPNNYTSPNYTIRTTDSETATRAFLHYNLYIVDVEEIEDRDAWHAVVLNHTATSHVDNDWDQLPIGRYRYIVESVYTNDNLSHPTYSMWIEKVVSEDDITITPVHTALKTNYPNPFNPITKISFDLSKDSNVQINVYNIRGQRVKTLTDAFHKAGSHSVIWNGTDNANRAVGSGVYFYKMTADDFNDTRKMILLK
jgi:hypothetical protein